LPRECSGANLPSQLILVAFITQNARPTIINPMIRIEVLKARERILLKHQL
jgi:hypothetical protein